MITGFFRVGLTATEMTMMYFLKEDSCTISQLTRKCECSRRTIQRSIKKLMKKKLIDESGILSREKIYKLANRGFM